MSTNATDRQYACAAAHLCTSWQAFPSTFAMSSNSYARWTIAQLHAECARQGLDTAGKKRELIDRSDDRSARHGAHTRGSRVRATHFHEPDASLSDNSGWTTA